ncbi:uncharacterized protein LOC131030327 [Cryptomeria japonica]|uniref:uncharacterized protein LOC131030327 n=1 Tax=Cryptomeria japonica TaxID=3369 RepID=UPI0025AC54CB|nr:uncharacterized protein LOC131030327 [Cryptomeria japonica]
MYNSRQCNNHNDERRTNSGEIASNWNSRDRTNNVSNNRGNYGNNGNHGNNGNGNNRNGNNSNGGGNNENNGNNGENGNYQTKKRDDPKLCNPRATKKDEFSQIMDMLKDMKGKQNHNEKSSPYRGGKPMNYNRLRLHHMPYNTNWKDGKPMNANLSKETPDRLKKVNNLVEEYPWCEVYNLPHVAEKCMIAQGFAEEDYENEYEPIVNVLSSDPFWGRDEDSSKDEKSLDVQWRRESQQHNVQQVFTDDDADIPSLRRLFYNGELVHSLRKLIDEEKKAYTVVAIA